MNSLPKISFGIIVLNGEPFLRYNLQSIYPYAHQIIIVEGAVKSASKNATPDGHSRDGTLENIYRFKDKEDKKDIVQIITRDGFWTEKEEMCIAFAERSTGDYLWQIDIDEFYKAKDVQVLIEMLANDPEISSVSFKTLTFWGGFNYLCDGWYLHRGAETFHRLFKWGPGFKYVSHRPPEVNDASGIDVRSGKKITSTQLVKKGIFLYHYALVFPKQVSDKCYYYKNAQWAKRKRMMDWADKSYYSIEKPFRVHNVYNFPSWLKRFNGDHPEQILRLQNDILNNRIKIETRNNEDIEEIIDSAKYKLISSILNLIEKPDRLAQKVRSLISDLVSSLKERAKKFMTPYNA